MADLILHHYGMSPFAEKARLMLGFKKLAWKSVTIPAVMPKPDVVALTGGYRRTPFLQVGADIYCDTALIAEVLELRAPEPSLFPVGQDGQARILAQWADTVLFWTIMPYCFQPQGLAFIFAGQPPEVVAAFGADRAAMRGNSPRMHPSDAHGQAATQIDWLDNMLHDGHHYFLGAQPSLADFSIYHCLWFVRRIEPMAGILTTRLLAWMDRMSDFGHGAPEKLSSSDAIAIAAASAPAPIDAPFVDLHGIALGSQVAITPNDYARDAVVGELVIASATELAVRRVDERAGEVVVHFPRNGYGLKQYSQETA